MHDVLVEAVTALVFLFHLNSADRGLDCNGAALIVLPKPCKMFKACFPPEACYVTFSETKEG